MFYLKRNVPTWERILRVLAGVILLVTGYMFMHGAWQFHFYSAGIVAALTGFVGFCPMCYLFGRRLKSPNE